MSEVDEVGVRLTLYDRAKFSAEAKAAEKDVESLGNSVERQNIKLSTLKATANDLGNPFQSFGKTASSAMGDIERSASSLTNVVKGVYSPLTSLLGNSGVQAGLFGVAAGFTAAAGAATYFGLKMNNSMQQSNVAFSHMLGSKSAGNDFTNQLVQMANVTPFTFESIAGPAQRLLNTGDSTGQALKDLTAIGDAAAGADPMEGQQGIDRIALAISQIKRSPFAHSQDFNQLVQANIDPYGLLAKATGKSPGDVQKDVENNKIKGSSAANILLNQFESPKLYGGLMQEQNKTLSGQWSNLVGNAQVDMAKATQPLADLLQRDMPSIQRFMETKLVPAFIKGENITIRWGQALGLAFLHGGADGFVAKLGEMTGHSQGIEEIWTHIKKDGSAAASIFVHEYLPGIRIVSEGLLGFAQVMEPVFSFAADHPRLFTDLFEVFIGGMLLMKIGGVFASITSGIGSVILGLTEAIATETTLSAAIAADQAGLMTAGGAAAAGTRGVLGAGAVGAVEAGGAGLLATGGAVAGGLLAGGVAGYELFKQQLSARKLMQNPRTWWGGPGMASGGTVTAGGMAMVGEQGPELLNLPPMAQVQPLDISGAGGPRTTVIFQPGAITIPAADYLDGKALADTVVAEIETRIAHQ